MASIPAFAGFPEAGIQFLRDLEQNNDKVWFDNHKQIYVDDVRTPALSLVVALGERLQAELPPISYDARTNGGSLMRIYRDTRFSKDKSPYKTNVAMMFTPEGTKRLSAPGFGLQISTEQVELVAGIFGFDKSQLTAYRDAVIDEEKGDALINAIASIETAGDYRLGEKDLKRVPRDYDKEHPRAEWLRHKGLHVFAPPMPIAHVYQADFVDEVMAHFHNMSPVVQWLQQMDK